MYDLTGVTHHPVIEELSDVLCNRTQNTDKSFFRAELAYFIGKLASTMRVTVATKDRGELPVNVYALALATSGFGKGYSVNIIEEEVLAAFKERFLEETFPLIADKNLWDIANKRAARKATDPEEEREKVLQEFNRLGAYPFTFDSGTTPAIKQLRQKLLLANCGAINLQTDEIGSNLVGATEVLTTFLELYDQGIIKQKLTKNTAESIRSEEIDGKTPANMLLFGTPSKLLDGGQAEDEFYSMLETGYARRCIFGIGQQNKKASHLLTPEEIYRNLTHSNNSATVDKWREQFRKLADPVKFGSCVYVPDDVAVELIRYKVDCEQIADALPEHKEIAKAEISHRFSKALKLAGAFAYIDGVVHMTMDHLRQAILLVEESGEAFKTILNREKSYVKLAKYIAAESTDLTHADLHEALPFYKSSVSARNEMMSLAIAWGHKQHIIIKKSYVDGIEFFRGETLTKTDLNKMILSYSNNFAYDYITEENGVPFDQLHILAQAQDTHWANHSFVRGHRTEDNVIEGFNMVVLDIDHGVSLVQAQELMKDYTYLTYTTKRSTDDENRFRLIIPINYHLDLDSDDYKEFMTNIEAWLPFEVDSSTHQRSRKWASHEHCQYHYNQGELLDALQFIPRTAKNEQYLQDFQKIESMGNLERWFAQRMAIGNRNNNMLRYALALMNTGMSFTDVAKHVYEFNAKLSNKLAESEIDSTILQTVAKRYTN